MRPLVITRDLQIELARFNSGVAISRAAYDLTEAALALGDPSICKEADCDELREHRCAYCVGHVRAHSPGKWTRLGITYWLERWAA